MVHVACTKENRNYCFSPLVIRTVWGQGAARITWESGPPSVNSLVQVVYKKLPLSAEVRFLKAGIP